MRLLLTGNARKHALQARAGPIVCVGFFCALGGVPFLFSHLGGIEMRNRTLDRMRSGKIGYILLWLLGVPIPILLIIYVLKGCT